MRPLFQCLISLACGRTAQSVERLLQPQGMEHARAVGADLHAGADLAQLGRLLVDLDLDAAQQQGERAGEPADAGADDDDRIS